MKVVLMDDEMREQMMAEVKVASKAVPKAVQMVV